MPRPLGSRNGIKATDPQTQAVAQLQAIIANEELPVESRQKALETLEALKPAPQQPTRPWPGYMECLCRGDDPFAAESESCADCCAYIKRERERYKALQAAKRKNSPDGPADVAAFEKELDAIEKELFE